MSLSLAQIMSMPMQPVSHQISIQAKMLTGVGNQISRDYPAHLTKTVQLVGDRDQRGPYDRHLDVDEEHTKCASIVGVKIQQ